MEPHSFALPTRAALAALLALATLPAQAVGHLADVTIVDRNTGATLPVHYAHGEYWVAGRPGTRYAITVRNRIGERVLAVPSVDGVNVLSGETAAWDQRGYVFSAYEGYQISGWRKNSREIAAFEFSSVANSYASRTGRPAHVGVIGVALFREQSPLPAPSVASEPDSQRRESGPPASPPFPAPTPRAEASGRSMSGDTLAKAAPALSARLGTAHGQRETSIVTHTNFTRLQEHPNEIIRIRYDSRTNLIASGVIREPVARPHVPQAFPQSGTVSYVPDPNWRHISPP